MTRSDLYTILPTLLLVAWACVLLLVDLFIPKGRKSWTALLAAVGLAGAMGVTIAQVRYGPLRFRRDGCAGWFLLFPQCPLPCQRIGCHRHRLWLPQAHGTWSAASITSLILFSLSGMLLMSQAADLIIVFLSLELLSIPLVCPVGLRPPAHRVGGGRHQVFPAGRLRHRFRRLRHRPGLRCHG